MDLNEALLTLTDEVYLPTFVKKAAELGIDLSNPDDLTQALEISSVLNAIQQEQNSSVVKSAHDTLMAAVGAAQPKAKPAPRKAPPVEGKVKEALDALKKG